MNKLLVALLCMPALLSAAAPTGYVMDGAGVLGNSRPLEMRLRAYEQKTTVEISIVTIKSLNGQDIDQYTNKLFREYGVGKKGKNNGVMILVAVDDHKMRIEVGYGLEPQITDGDAGDIIRNQMKPAFRRGDFLAGVSDAVTALQERIR